MTPEIPEKTARIATDLAKKLLSTPPSDTATVVALSGDLGAGKTTFTQAVAKTFGITETVTSPTFVIEKIYKIGTEVDASDTNIQVQRFKHFIHIDAYRIEKSHELEAIGWKEIIADPGNLIFIEWAERVVDLLPKHYTKISFAHRSETERDISIEQP